jgi:hypothetical protein
MARTDIGEHARLYERDEWEARDWRDATLQGDSRLREVFLHHSDTALAERIDRFEEQVAAMQGFQNFHMDVRGWDDIGYHFIVFQEYGNLEVVRIFRGRPVNHVPAAQAGRNTGTVAICTVGDFQGDDGVKPKTIQAIIDLIKHVKRHNADNLVTVGGHRDVVATSCPGDTLYAHVPTIARATGLRRF